MAGNFDIQGLNGVLDKMRTLSPKLQKRGLRQAARKGMKPVQDAARVGAQAIDDPQSPAKIYKNIVTREQPRESRKVGGVVMSVGVLGGASRNQHSKDASGNPGGDTRHWRYDEFGTEHQAAKPFMRPALANNVEKVTSIFVTEINVSIDRIIKTGQ